MWTSDRTSRQHHALPFGEDGGDMAERTRRAMSQLVRAASRPPCIIVLGESNSGKTTAINALLGDGLLPTGVITNTRFPTLVRFGEEVSAAAVTATGERVTLASDAVPSRPVAFLEVTLPSPRLREFEILDTPAHFDADTLTHVSGLSTICVPVWCTVATQAWKESERRHWVSLDGRTRRNGILTVTGIDRVVDPEEIARLFSRLDAEAARYFSALAYSTVPSAPRPLIGLPHVRSLADTVATTASRLGERRRRTVAKLATRLEQLSMLLGRNEGAQ